MPIIIHKCASRIDRMILGINQLPFIIYGLPLFIDKLPSVIDSVAFIIDQLILLVDQLTLRIIKKTIGGFSEKRRLHHGRLHLDSRKIE
ncbi:hypothetical protein AZH11_05865 [Pseudomonas simiae]|nr:hypothetical protein AZH11_05865 [Pseudomonas simiae]